MRVRFLGTGAASGWPNPYCSCSSCCNERAAGRARSSTSLLVDEQLLLDCGPAALDGARALHQSLAAVEHVVITHGHPDHLAPAFLLFRDWAHAPEGHDKPQLHLWAPPLALTACEPWIAPQDLGSSVQLHALVAGTQHQLTTANASYTLRTLPASHVRPVELSNGEPGRDEPDDALASEAVLLDLEDGDGVRLLYATDTGLLSPAALAMTSDREYHLACIEETFGSFWDHHTGHLDLRTFASTVEQLANTRAIKARTTVIAVHLGHHNPPTPKLREMLAPMGADVVDDGTTLTLSASRVDTQTARDVAPRSTHLVLGGARSGKSRHAEALAAQFDSVVYIACARRDSTDAEWMERIAAHRQRRPGHWRTEETTQLAAAIKDHQDEAACILIDCLGTWVTALVDDADTWQDRSRATTVVMSACDALATAIGESRTSVVLVTNEVGSGVVPSSASGRLFRDLLGMVNLRVAQVCDKSTLMVAGRGIALADLTAHTTVEDVP